ncbi:LysR family transcriptional regulator [Paratractidigestivibacter sp.]|uniref:LysR family transcriptional regulator n=1 Tax=Paratractidigestivibacter sp. TaxID=2847316 RepID=UPI002ABE77D0|nr:LysR family transcriptional regulator [Paratractidigestivibacter sp.]
MNINRIKYFVFVFEHSSFPLATKSQGITVQAVSKAINDLERKVGVKRFAREPLHLRDERRPRLLQEGPRRRHGIPQARGVPRGGRRSGRGPALLPPPVFQGSDALTRSLAEFAHEKIGVDVDFSIVNPQTVRKDLGASVDALVTIGVLDRETIKRTPAGKLSTGIMISRDHPLAQSPMVSAADLADYPAAVSPWYDTFNTSILVMYRDAGIVSNIREATSLEESRELLANDRGYFFSAMYPRQHEEDDPSCCARSTPTESIGPEFEGFALPVFPPRRKTLIFRLINPCL